MKSQIEDTSDIAQYQQELDRQEIRDKEMRKVLRMYNCTLINSLARAGIEHPGIDDLFEIKAREFVLRAKDNDINL